MIGKSISGCSVWRMVLKKIQAMYGMLLHHKRAVHYATIYLHSVQKVVSIMIYYGIIVHTMEVTTNGKNKLFL